MAYKVLGQQAPASANYSTALYTVPSGKAAICSTLVVTNRSSAVDTFRVRVAVANAADSSRQYIAYDTLVLPNSIVPLTLGMSLAATDVVYAGSAAGNCSFQLFGDES